MAQTADRQRTILYIADLQYLLPYVRDTKTGQQSSALAWGKFRTPATPSAKLSPAERSAHERYSMRRSAVRVARDGWAILGIYDEILVQIGFNRRAAMRGWICNHHYQPATVAQVAGMIGCSELKLLRRAMATLEDEGLLVAVPTPDIAGADARDAAIMPNIPPYTSCRTDDDPNDSNDSNDPNETNDPNDSNDSDDPHNSNDSATEIADEDEGQDEDQGEVEGEDEDDPGTPGEQNATGNLRGPKHDLKEQRDQRKDPSEESQGVTSESLRLQNGSKPCDVIRETLDVRRETEDARRKTPPSASAMPPPLSADGFGCAEADEKRQTADVGHPDGRPETPDGSTIGPDGPPDTPTGDMPTGHGNASDETGSGETTTSEAERSTTEAEPIEPTEADPNSGNGKGKGKGEQAFEHDEGYADQVDVVAREIAKALYPTRRDLVIGGRRKQPPQSPDEFERRELGSLVAAWEAVMALGIGQVELLRLGERAVQEAGKTRRKPSAKIKGACWRHWFNKHMAKEFGPRWTAANRTAKYADAATARMT